MRYDRLKEQKIFKEEEEKERATMRWHDKDPADYSNSEDTKQKSREKS